MIRTAMCVISENVPYKAKHKSKLGLDSHGGMGYTTTILRGVYAAREHSPFAGERVDAERDEHGLFCVLRLQFAGERVDAKRDEHGLFCVLRLQFAGERVDAKRDEHRGFCVLPLQFAGERDTPALFDKHGLFCVLQLQFTGERDDPR